MLKQVQHDRGEAYHGAKEGSADKYASRRMPDQVRHDGNEYTTLRQKAAHPASNINPAKNFHTAKINIMTKKK
jgi:hypothetical protein